MDYEPLKNEYVKTKNFVVEQFLPPFQQYHNEILEHINSYSILYSNWKSKLQAIEDKSEAFKITAELHRQIESNLEKQSARFGNKLPFTQYDHLNKFFIELY